MAGLIAAVSRAVAAVQHGEYMKGVRQDKPTTAQYSQTHKRGKRRTDSKARRGEFEDEARQRTVLG